MASGRGLADHPVIAFITVVAGIATIIGVITQLGWLAAPSAPSIGRSVGCHQPTISFSDGAGPSGTKLTVQGSGFPANVEIELVFFTEQMAPAQSDEKGTFKGKVVIPGTMDPFAPKQVDIRATSHDPLCFTSRPFKLTS